MTLSVPYSFVPGTKAKAQEVNANFSSLVEQIDETNSLKLNKDLSNLAQEGLDFIKNSVSGKNLGEIVYSAIPLEDAGLKLLDGSVIQGSGVYSDFVDYIAELYDDNSEANYFTTESDWQDSVETYGVCGKFVYNSQANTVRLPKITGIIEGTTDVTALGELTRAGLPNISGNIIGDGNTGIFGYATGAMTVSAWVNGVSGTSTAQGYCTAGIDASRSSAIYGNSDTVQPQTVSLLVYIVVATAIKNEAQLDIDSIASDLNNKADCDLSNCTRPYITETYRNGLNGYVTYSNGLCIQWGSIRVLEGEATASVILFKPYTDTSYISYATCGVSICYASATPSTRGVLIVSGRGHDYTLQSTTVHWLTIGYIV